MTISEGNRPASTESVEPPWGDRLRPGDERSSQVTSGGWRGTVGRFASRYGWVALLIVANCFVNVLTAIQHTASGATNLRGPIVDESTSALVLIMLLPIYGLLWPVPAFPNNLVPYIMLAWILIGGVYLFFIENRRPRLLAYP